MSIYLSQMHALFGESLLENVPMARYTSARIGGPAEALLLADSREDLVKMVITLVQHRLPFIILGSGSNVLISDSGLPGVVLINRAHKVQFEMQGDPPYVWVESGASLGLVARQAATHGLSGLEWACGIPGTVGGAIFGNAGAHGYDMASNLMVADILHLTSQVNMDQIQASLELSGTDLPGILPVEQFSAQQCGFAYRTSVFKRQQVKARMYPSIVILSAKLSLQQSTSHAVQEKIEVFTAYRRRTQPPGASLGSMFKNPPGDYAGRLIESVGLKGASIGGAQISPLHGNFFVNQANATAADVYSLIQLARETVYEKTGIHLELEIELLGEYG